MITILQFPIFTFGQLDTSFVQSIIYPKTIALHSTLKNFKVTFSNSEGNKIALQNYNLGVGIRVRYKNLGASVGVPIASFNKSSAGKPKSLGFGFHLFPSAFFFQGTFQYIKGFDDLNAVNNEPSLIFRNDNKMFYTSLISNYVFNHRKFSLGAAFKMLAIQKKSAGSWIISLPINHQYFATDSLNISIQDKPQFQLDLYQSFKVGLGGGYAYSLVNGNWSATILATGGAEFRNLKYRNARTNAPINEFLISPRIRLVSSIVYNKPSFFYGIVGQYLPGLEVAEGLNTRVENLRIRVIFGRRFR